MEDREGLLGQVAPEEPSDACCWACSGGGDVACCDGCRAVYHLSCIGLEQLPEDDWFCPLCCCRECRTACRGQEDPAFINTKLLPVLPKQLPLRVGPHQRFPAGPGYLCPQQARLWLQPPPEEQQQQDAAGSAGPVAAAAAAAAAAAGGKPAGDAAEEPSAKRQKQEPRSSSGSVSPTGGAVAAAAFVRCCCCQAACHVNCLPPPLKQQYVGRPPLAGLVPQPPPQPPAPQANGTPGKRSTPRRQQQQQGKASPSGQKQQQQQQQQLPSPAAAAAGSPPAPVDPYFCSLVCQQAANQLASRCAQGMVQVDSLADGTPVAFQVVQPAAVAAALAGSGAGAGAAAAGPHPQAAVGLLGTGVAAGHSVAQAVVLARVVRDATVLLARQLGPAWEVRSLDDTLPWLVGGLRQAVPGGMLDLSHAHLGLLWVGGTLAGAAVLRLHGPSLLEVPLAATQQELHHKQLGKLLLGCIERLAFDTCKVRQAWLPALNDVARPCTGVSLLPTAEQQQPGQRQQLALDPGCSVRLLGLDSAAAAAAAAAAAGAGSGGSRARQRQQAQQQSQARRKSAGDAQTCWGHQLGYGPAQTVADWMQLPRHMLLRFSYVPFLTKRLGPDSLVPLPKFSSRPLAAAVAPAAAADASGPTAAAAEGGPAGSSGWPSEAAPREARRLVADSFPTPADIPGYQLQPVRRTKRQAKRRKWEDAVELPLDDEDEDMMLMQQPADEPAAVEASDDAAKGQAAEAEQQQQRQQQRSKRQEFQEQVRQQFLARQQALSKPRRQQRQGKQVGAGGTADAAPTQETAAADDGAAASAAVAAAAQAVPGGGAADDAAAAAADAQAVAAAAEPGGPADAPAAAVAGEGTPA